MIENLESFSPSPSKPIPGSGSFMTSSIAERRLTTLFRLASETAYQTHTIAVMTQAAAVLHANCEDFPCLVLYHGEDGSIVHEHHCIDGDVPFFVKLSGKRDEAQLGGILFGIDPKKIFDREYRHFLLEVSACIEAALQGASAFVEAQKAVSNANDMNKIKTNFLANMSHEIRTPLSAIIGYTALLKDARLTANEAEYLQIISKNGEALTHLIDDILDLSKVEAGKLTIELKPFHFRELMVEVKSLFEKKADDKGLALTLSIDPSIPSVLHSDCARIRQILINVIGNALKFTAEGGVHIEVRGAVSPLRKDKINLSLRITDTGMGLDDDQKAALFQPFVQLEHTQGGKFGGTGLGLSLSRRLARALGGDLVIERSMPGEGSTFAIDVSVRTSQVELIEAPSHVREGQLKGCSVLVIDDSPDNRFLLSRMLRVQGASIIEAADGEEGVQKAFQNNFDVILMDIQMPRMDGFAALAQLRLHNYPAPIIALTAHAMKDEREKMFEAGFDGHVAKPIDQAVLFESMLELLDRRSHTAV